MGNENCSRLPWRVGGRPSLKIWSDYDNEVVTECWMVGGTKGEANAAFIVKACNAHDSLIKCAEALRGLLRATVASEPIDDEQLFKALTESRAALLSLEESSK